MKRQAGAVSPTLASMPTDVIERIAASLPTPRDLAAANATSRLFRRAPPGGRSSVERALRERAHARGHTRALPPTLFAGTSTWTEELLVREATLAMARAHAAVVAGGINFSAFVDAEGGLHTCGEEEERDELWRRTGEYRPHSAAGHTAVPIARVPVRVVSLAAVRVRSVAARGDHLLALSDAGAVYACGHNDFGQLGLGSISNRRGFRPIAALADVVVVCITAGGLYSLALTAAGCAYSWGFNCYGQLGHGDNEEQWEPTRIEALDGVRVGGLAAGRNHTLLMSAHGAVYSCGDGSCGQLGHGDEQDQHTPRRIEALAGVRAVHVSAGCAHSLVVDGEGAVYAFGRAGGAHAPTLPTRMWTLACVRAVSASAGDASSAVLGADGSVHTFGNEHGQLGLDAAFAPTAPSHARVLECTFGFRHTLVVTADGAAYACGHRSAAAALGLGLSDRGADETEAVLWRWTPVTRIEQLPRLLPGLPGGGYCRDESVRMDAWGSATRCWLCYISVQQSRTYASS